MSFSFTGPSAVELTADGAAKQRRLTVAFGLILSRSARNLLAGFVALGLICAAGAGCSAPFPGTTNTFPWTAGNDIAPWGSAATTLATEMTGWTKANDTCVENADITCASLESETAAGYLSAFEDQASGLPLPSAATAAETRLLAIADKCFQDFEVIGTAFTVDEYQGDVAGTNLTQDLRTLHTDLTSVINTLSNSQGG
jgi:hypothetical protein